MARNRVIYNSEALFAGQKVGKNCYAHGADPFGDGEGLTTAVKFYLDGTKDQRNYFIQTSAEGIDAINDEDNRKKSITYARSTFVNFIN